MNYLAHIFLSGDEPAMMVGGLLGDFVKGPIAHQPDNKVTTGIVLHRRIDQFVDQQAEVKHAIARIPSPYRRYGGILIDMMYDHFLAQQWQHFHSLSLDHYCQRFYQHLHQHYEQLPPRAQRFADIAPTSRWLEGYAQLDNMPRYLEGVSRRLRRPFALQDALPLLQIHYNELHDEFNQLLPKTIEFSQSQLAELNR